MSAMAGRRLAAERRVPERHRPSASSYSAPTERGKNSYQEPTRARRRCTVSGNRLLRVVHSRSGLAASEAVTSSDSARARRSAAGTEASRIRSAAAASSGRRGTRRAARSSSRAPSSRVSSVSWSSGILASARRRQVANGSAQASTANDQRPGSAARSSAV